MRDAVVVEHDEAVIDSVEAELGTNVANGDTGQRSVVFEAADLHTEWMRTKVLAVQDETGHDDGVVGSLAETTNPPLGGSQGGRVDLELVGLVDVRGSGLQTLDVGTVADLCPKAMSLLLFSSR